MPKYRNLTQQNGLSYIRTELGKNILAARKKADLTQDELSTRAGIARATLANIETDRQNITLEVLYSIANALGISIGSLLPANDFNSPFENKTIQLNDVRKRFMDIKELAECILEECS